MGHIGQAINLDLKGMSSKGRLFFFSYIDKDVFMVDQLYYFYSWYNYEYIYNVG